MCGNRVRRMASNGTRLCPPASTLASSPYSASNDATSATDSGAWYSKAAGFMDDSDKPADGWERRT